MMKWAKKQMANAAGTPEPIYGASAVIPVGKQAETTPYTELTRDDMKWAVMDSTSVETQTFYIMADNGHIAMAQVIYSNVAGIRTTAQFNTKINYPKGSPKPLLFSTDQLSKVEFSDDKTCFYADNCAVDLSEDGIEYTIKSMTNKATIVNLTITRVAPAFHIGKDGKTYYGTDPEAPWGAMRHAFWPRTISKGSITTKDGSIDFAGKALFIHALQGMKPHHAAARWNFVDYQGPQFSAIMMEYTTPPSYGSTIVSVGGIVKDGEIIYAGAGNTVKHTKVRQDPGSDWPEPEAVRFDWTGKTKDGKSVSASMELDLGERLDRLDVMQHVPGFVKKIVAGAAGTRPYIYQYSPRDKPTVLKMKIGDEEITEEGTLYTEATFISE
ncbi:survival factor 1 protein [Rutstroemia sp. NJR-2017a WRK4]|nr:survival factor 1 protein [Rutstroemia sp. NJR-2017a WRK4]